MEKGSIDKFEHHTSHPTPTPKKRRGPCCSIVCSVIFFFLAILSGAIAVFTPSLVKDVIADLLPIRNPTSLLYGPWQDAEAAGLGVTRKFYFFNITNAEEVVKYHRPIDFNTVGPFVFLEHTYSPKEDIRWKPDATIDFKYYTDMHFVPEESIDEKTGVQLTLNSTAVCVNFPMIDALWRLDQLLNDIAAKQHGVFDKVGDKFVNDLVCEIMASHLDNEKPIGDLGVFMNRTVGEYLRGYHEPMWQIMYDNNDIFYDFKHDRPYNVPTFYRGVFNASQPAPSPASPRYGQQCPNWNDQSVCNSSGSHFSTVQSGQSWTVAAQDDVNGGVKVGAGQRYGDLKELNTFVSWAGQEKMWWWGDQNDGQCQKFGGSNGLNGWPGITKDDHPAVFFDAIFRKIQLKYHSTALVEDLEAYKFVMDDIERIAGPHNECYGQTYDGVMNMTQAEWAPLYITNPYFFNVPTSQHNIDVQKKHGRNISLVNVTIEGVPIAEWKEKNSGLRDNFETYLNIEPNTGATLEASGFLQPVTFVNNLKLEQCRNVMPEGLIPKILGNKNFTTPDGRSYVNDEFPETMAPFFYMIRHAKIPPHLNAKIYHKVMVPLKFSKYGGYGFMALSIVLFLFFTLRSACRVTVGREDYLTEAGLGESTRLNSPTPQIQSWPKSHGDDTLGNLGNGDKA